eukprot:5870804-Pyramimonas_sp.AAC.1
MIISIITITIIIITIIIISNIISIIIINIIIIRITIGVIITTIIISVSLLLILRVLFALPPPLLGHWQQLLFEYGHIHSVTDAEQFRKKAIGCAR